MMIDEPALEEMLAAAAVRQLEYAMGPDVAKQLEDNPTHRHEFLTAAFEDLHQQLTPQAMVKAIAILIERNAVRCLPSPLEDDDK